MIEVPRALSVYFGDTLLVTTIEYNDVAQRTKRRSQ